MKITRTLGASPADNLKLVEGSDVFSLEVRQYIGSNLTFRRMNCFLSGSAYLRDMNSHAFGNSLFGGGLFSV